MRGSTHFSAGLFFSMLYLFLFPFELHSLFVSLSILLGSLLPDIDKTTSYVGKKVPLLGFIFDHRTFFHSFWGLWFVTLLVLALFSWEAALGLFVGYLFHLALDSLTPQGIRFFYPFKKRSSGKYRTGGFIDTLLRYTFFGASLVFFFLLLV